MHLRQTKILGLALLVGGLVVAGAGLRLLVSHNQYRATATTEGRKPAFNPGDVSYGGRDGVIFSPQALQSDLILSNLAVDLNLPVVWAKNRGAGNSKLNMPTVIDGLRQRMELKLGTNPLQIVISFYSEDPKEAARLANTLCQCFEDYLESLRIETEKKNINFLEAWYQDQEKEIVTVQSNVNALAKKLGLSPDYSIPISMIAHYQEMINETGKTYQNLYTQMYQLKSLNKDRKDRLREVLPAIWPDGTLSMLLEKLHEAERQDERLKSEYPTNDPVRLKLRHRISQLNEQIDDRMTGIVSGIETRLASQKAVTDMLVQAVTEAKQRQQKGVNEQPYWEARKLLDEHHVLGVKIETERVNLRIPQQQVRITGYAEPSRYPVGPNRPLGALLLGVGLFPILAGWLLIKPRWV